MIKVGITGLIASGKTTASKIISKNNGPLFSADKVVKKLYALKKFKKIVSKKLSIEENTNFKKAIKIRILKSDKFLLKLGKIIHPLVRKQMHLFTKKNNNKKFLFFEIPLLIENKLYKYFDIIILIKSKKSLRSKRYSRKIGHDNLFAIFDKKQLKDNRKVKFCNHIVVNNSSLVVLKKKLNNIISLYE